jgi:glutamyl-tRNA synthetase
VSIHDQESLKESLRKHAIANAMKFGGKANPKAIAGKAFSEDPTLKDKAAEVFRLADEVVAEVNSMAPESLKTLFDSLGMSLTKEKVKQDERLLPPLPNVERYERVRVRFAPNPDSVIHLGNTRAALLSDQYAKMYKGDFILRFEDTSPSIKPPEPEAYEVIREDLRWLEVHWGEEHIQSSRLPIYYEYAVKVISMGGAYICNCPSETFRSLAIQKRACPCRDLPADEQLRRWGDMLNGKTKMGGSVLRIKTDLEHPNPAIRDWPAMRIDTKAHPLQGKKFRVWPLYNFASGIDDHLMGVTHIFRGKEHEVNMHRQMYLYRHLGWVYPEAIHYGRLKIEGTVLSKSKIRAGIEQGVYSDWSDPRLGTIAALRRRGFLPETIRKLIIEVGVKPSEALISWDNLESINRKILDPVTKRYVFIPDPVELELSGLEKAYSAKVPLHPDHPEWGAKEYVLGPGKEKVVVQRSDASGLAKKPMLRLMNLFNIALECEGKCRFLSEGVTEARAAGASIVQWLPASAGKPLEVVMQDGKRVEGRVEESAVDGKLPATFQFYRFGFVRIVKENAKPVGYYTHP